MRKLLLLGAGYGNMRILLRLLNKDLPSDIEITLVDRTPFHSLKTEFYALAAGTVPDSEIRVAIPNHEQLKVVEGEIKEIKPNEKEVVLADGQTLTYDNLVIGLGCVDNFHNVPGAEENTLSIQTIGKSRKTYQTLLGLSGGATVGIVGAGLSGIELASELRESRPDLNIKLFDRSPRILRDFPERLSNYVKSWFDQHEVEVVANSNITKVGPTILYNHEETIDVDAVVWTAGIKPSHVIEEMEVEKDRSGRVVLNQYHQIPNHPNVYVVGDVAALPHAPSAQLAEVQAEQIVQVLRLLWNNEPLMEKMPELKLKGFMGSLGKKQGFAYLADRTVTGRIARLMKSGLLWMYKWHNG
ncbi:NAD(P)/FAD-dependent oxidoreductase [Sporosarcina obsidiansis]|uniref:NAD(P)/FAD-dependent oxidoreductase n=1 Tax=Sporosarcina obsidiansis TaxID=2660748 RepID=UPI00129B7D4D|nr:NAD(P)/FAD-dependent oxidoreductase [Sporosarcina obsidiansis]